MVNLRGYEKISLFCCGFGYVLSIFGVCASADEPDFIVADAVITVSENEDITDNYSADHLKCYLDEITNGDIEIVTDGENAEYKIALGSFADDSSLADGSYTIKSTGNELIIIGAGNKGTINGVYAFLEKYCGCHWYESDSPFGNLLEILEMLKYAFRILVASASLCCCNL